MIPELDTAIYARINAPTVLSVFEEWKNRGLLFLTQEFLGRLEPETAIPIHHSFVTHVHKEKGLFVEVLGKNLGINSDIRKPLAVSADMLWAISLMFDDIEDEDTMRGNLQTCWVKFGKQQTLAAALNGTKKLLEYLTEKVGNSTVASSCTRYIQIGLRSLREHRLMDLETPVGIITRNYENRCDFHGTFQLSAMWTESQEDQKFKLAISGLRLFNQGGQLINDLKDFTDGDLYGRSFSDIRRGVPTIPLSYLYNLLSPTDRSTLLAFFGKGTITPTDSMVINELVTKSNVLRNTLARIADCYRDSIAQLAEVVSPQDLSWFQKWAEYKQKNLVQQLLTHD
ncbi:polyprenyl synthetase family protein [Candidatus Daviesbacteria bacterium]|nr:polyprenyl synthetase family protein [Candidatus Daviesbacteria bacterium]